MLNFELREDNAGFILWGDRLTFKPLADYLHKLADSEREILSEGLVRELATTLIEAIDEKHQVDALKIWGHETKIFGVSVDWLTITCQTALASHASKMAKSSQHEKELVLLLEEVLEGALAIAIPSESYEYLSNYKALKGIAESHIVELLDGRREYFMKQQPTKRKVLLPELLKSMLPMWSDWFSKNNTINTGLDFFKFQSKLY